MKTAGTGKRNVKGQVRKGLAAVLTLALALAIAGCGGKGVGQGQLSAPEKATSSPVASPSASPTAQTPAHTTYPLTVKDATGTDVVFDKAPQRIVSIAPSETEVLYAVGAGPRVVGVDNYSDYPDDAKTKAKVGDMNLNVEALLALKPDVVFANSSLSKKQIDQLRGLGVKVFGSDPQSVEDVIARVELYGKILDTADAAKKTADTMQAQEKQVVDAVKGLPAKKVYIEFSPGYTVGSGVFMSDLIAMAGGTNVLASKQGYFPVDPEAVIKADPEVILYAKSSVNPDDLKKRPGWDAISAVKNGQLYPIDDNLLARVSPRITQTLIEFGKAIHPDKVK